MTTRKEKFDISVIVVNFQTYGLVYQCLSSAQSSFYNHKIEFIVVDNSIPKDKKALSFLSRLGTVKIIRSKKNLGYAGGINLGIKSSSGRYLAVINPDVTLLDGCLENLYEFAEKHPNAGMMSPKLINPAGSTHLSCRTFPGPFILFYKRLPFVQHIGPVNRRVVKHMMSDFSHNSVRRVDWVSGAFMFVRRDAVEKVGLMDERYFLYMEDIDWCRTFWRNGIGVYYVPGAKAIHIAQHLSTQFGFLGFFRRISWIHLQSYFKYFIKHTFRPRLGNEKRAIKRKIKSAINLAKVEARKRQFSE